MNCRRFVTAAATASLAGCAGLGDGGDNGQINLIVQNERAEPVTAQVAVVDEMTCYVRPCQAET